MTSDSLQARLVALPEPELPASLWPRVMQARVRQRARRQRILAGSLAGLALLALPFVHTRIAPPEEPMPYAAAPRAPLPADPLRTVDRELQQAYERGASEQELQWLWQQREALAQRSNTPALPEPLEI